MGFDPVTLGIAGLALSATGMVTQGVSQRGAAAYQSQVAANNAITEAYNARYAAASANADVDAQAKKGAAVGARIKVGQAANGVDVNSGSAARVQEGQRETSKLDTQTTQSNDIAKAYGYRAASISDTGQSQLLQNESDQAIPGALMGGAGTILGDASSLAFKWAPDSGSSSAVLGPLQNSPAL